MEYHPKSKKPSSSNKCVFYAILFFCLAYCSDKKECNIHYLPEPIKEVVREKLLSYKPDPHTAVGTMWYRDLNDIIPTLETHPDNYDQWKDYFWKINHKKCSRTLPLDAEVRGAAHGFSS